MRTDKLIGLTLALVILLPVLIAGCTKDKTIPATLTYNTCDTSNISYQLCVKPIFKNYCYPCHSDSASQNGNIAFDIENFNSLKNYLTLYYHNDSIYGSKFLNEIEQTPGIIHMPPTGKVPEVDISIINKWLENTGPYN